MSDIWKKECIIEPSVISVCDPLNMESSVKALERAGIEMLHIDILDGHFSPSMPMGFDVVHAIRKITDLPLDAHVMVTDNEFFVNELIDIGADQIIFHAETETHIDRMLNKIHAAGIRAGVALRPATPISVLEYAIEKCDAVLLMLINPGYASISAEGQVSYADRKIRELRDMINAGDLDTRIVLDGRISRQNIADYGHGIANLFVAGSTCLDKNNLEASAAKLLEEI